MGLAIGPQFADLIHYVRHYAAPPTLLDEVGDILMCVYWDDMSAE
jgi:hypothetical protein